MYKEYISVECAFFALKFPVKTHLKISLGQNCVTWSHMSAKESLQCRLELVLCCFTWAHCHPPTRGCSKEGGEWMLGRQQVPSAKVLKHDQIFTSSFRLSILCPSHIHEWVEVKTWWKFGNNMSRIYLKLKRIIVKFESKETQSISHVVQTHPTEKVNPYGLKNDVTQEEIFCLES